MPIDDLTALKGRLEIHSINSLQDVDTHGGIPHPKNFPGSEVLQRFKHMDRRSETGQGPVDSGQIAWLRVHQQVQVLGEPR